MRRQLGLWWTIMFVACGGPQSQATPHGKEDEVTASQYVQVPSSDESRGLQFELRAADAKSENEKPRASRNVVGKPVADAEGDLLLKGLPALPKEAALDASFAKRKATKPPPSVYTQTLGEFPPPEKAKTPDTQKVPLEVVRITPQGDVPVAAELTVTFNQPMTALASHADSTKGPLPVKLTPQPKGVWRWLGTRTLAFTPQGRFPMATEYVVEVAAQTRSANGMALAQAVKQTFRTPAPRLEESSPRDKGLAARRLPVLIARFDQAVDREALTKQAEFCWDAQTCVRARTATAQEIDGEEAAKEIMARARSEGLEARVVALMPTQALPSDQAVRARLGSIPSAEGPQRGQPTEISFRTHGKLQVVRATCGYQQRCAPHDTWVIEFTNPMQGESLDLAAFKVEPAAALQGVEAGYGEDGRGAIHMYVQAKARTEYAITIPASVRDVFGQALGEDKVARVSVGDPQPSLQGMAPMAVLDPKGPRAFEVTSIGVDTLLTSVQQVDPKTFAAFSASLSRPRRSKQAPSGGATKELKVADPLANSTTQVDLSTALRNGLGHAIVTVEPKSWPDQYKPRVQTWVQATNLALDIFQDRNRMYVWVSSLADGKPVTGATVTLEPAGISVTSDAKGGAVLELPVDGGKGGRTITARVGDDLTFYPERFWPGDQPSEWIRGKAEPEPRWFVFDDRGVYRPGESVHLKGWLRIAQEGPSSKPVKPQGLSKVRYKVQSANGHALTSGEAKPSPQGGFDFAFKLADDVDLGYAQIDLEAQVGSQTFAASHSVQVLEFRRPEYEVSLHVEDALHFVGDPIAVRSEARYYTGGPLAAAPTTVNVSATRAQFSPPNRSDFTFGEPIFWPMMMWGRGFPHPQEEHRQQFQALTGTDGKVALEIVPTRAEPAYPYTLNVDSSVQDVNRQTWSDSTTLLVHPATNYVGIKVQQGFIAQGESLTIDVVTVDLDGKDVAGRAVELVGFRPEQRREKGKTVDIQNDVQKCAFTSSGGPGRCAFKPEAAGSYEITARVRDDKGRPNETRFTAYVTGPATPGARQLTGEAVQMIPDKKEYLPGETANVLLQLPFAPAECVMMLQRDGVISSERIRIENTMHTLKVPLDGALAPNVEVNVSLVGKRLLDGREVPAFASGAVSLPIALKDKRLTLAIGKDADEVEPGSTNKLSVSVKGANNAPVARAEVSVIVVDEAVLALTQHELGDPLAAFFPPVPGNVANYATRPFVVLHDRTSDKAQEESATANKASGAAMRGGRASGALAYAAAPMAAADASAGGAVTGTPTLRKDLSPIALFAPTLVTDQSGVARVDLKLPDDLTRYRIFAVASAQEDQFGKTESTITARKALMVRPSAPRFLNFGDAFELPIVIENQSETTQSVLVAARASNLRFSAGRARQLEVPAKDRVEVRLPMTTNLAGTAMIQVAARGKTGSDAMQLSLPVWTPATDEAFATYGQLVEDGAVAQPLRVPTDAAPEFGGLEISTFSTQVAALTDAFMYVYEYPFECSEQLASRIITSLALRDVLAAFAVPEVPTEQALSASIDDAVKQLLEMQNADGGFPWWKQGGESSAYNTVHVLHALVRAQKSGVGNLDSAIQLARNAATVLLDRKQLAANDAVKRTLLAYVAYVDALGGKNTSDQVTRLWRAAKPQEHSVEATGWMLGALARSKASEQVTKELLNALASRASETASTAQFTDQYGDGAHLLLHSEQRSDAIALEGLMLALPDHDLAMKVAKGLLAHRRKGRWLNTQENAFAALALRAYFDHYERDTPNFEANAFLGKILAQTTRFSGRNTNQTSTLVPMSELASQSGPVVMQKIGKGRMYYRLGLRYAPKSLSLEANDQGFGVERSYEAVDGDGDVTRDAAGIWYVKAGARVRVNVTMIAKARRYHVALVDPLAGGFEPIQAGLHVTSPQTAPSQPPACPTCFAKRMWWGPWYEHENLRDERAEAFSSDVAAGVYTYSYTVRATTPGQFVVPPAKAEEMYMPETFGRTATDRVVIR
jgi:uncharacterized protein YfaS (alpha-2-macroglobulin family)